MGLVVEYIYLAIVFLVSISFHEFAHAFISYRLGDPTAKNAGRLTLNPLKHIDILGAIMIFIAHIGWAKPVPINPMYYKDRKKGTILVSVAGPLSNIVLAFIFTFPLVYIGKKFGVNTLNQYDFKVMMFNLCRWFFILNINLAIFNLIPVPPLDGSKILSGILPSNQYFKIMQYENYILIGFMIIIFVFSRQFAYVLNLIAHPVKVALLNIVDPIVGFLIQSNSVMQVLVCMIK